MEAACRFTRNKLRWSHAQLCDYVLKGKQDPLASTLACLTEAQKAVEQNGSSLWYQAFRLSTSKFLAVVTFCPENLHRRYEFTVFWVSDGKLTGEGEGTYFMRLETAAQAAVEHARRKLRWTRKQMDDYITSEVALTALGAITSEQKCTS